MAMTGSAFAQAAPDQTAAAPEQVALEEIVVTAQKRQENVQDVALAVAVVTAKQLESAGVRDFSDVARVAPSLTIRAAEHPVNASVALRGIGTFAFGIGVEPSVAVQIDDVPVAFQARAFADLTDVEQIEVLRGPQSTLYGKSASAGLINITTRAPSKVMSVLANALVTDDNEYRVAASLSGPLSDTVGFRLTASHSDYDGNVKNLVTGDKVNGRDDTTIRGKVVWKPTDNLSIDVGANYMKGTSTATSPLIRLSPNALLRGTPGLTPAVVLPGIVAGPDNLNISNDSDLYAKSDGFGQSLRIAYELPKDFSLVSISSHDQFRLDDLLDADRTSYKPLFNQQGGYFKSENVTQEIRLLSPDAGPFRYTVGLFYGDTDLTRSFKRGPSFSQAEWYAQASSTAKAVFGQGEWTFLPETTAIVGLRYQREEIGYGFNDYVALRANQKAFFTGGASDDAVTYRLGLRHNISDDVMVFGSFSTGHKGQTYDLTTGFNQARADAGPIRPETSDAFEAGVKSEWFGRRLMLNATAFHVAYDDFQAQGIEFIGGVQNYRLTNVGKVITQGVELEATARATRDLRLNGSIAYIDAKIDTFPGAACWPGQTAAQGCTGTPGRQNLAGATLPNAPKWKLNGGFDYSHTLGDLPFEGIVSGSYSWQSKVNFSLNQDPETVQKSYGVLNLSAGIRAPDEHYQLVAFVNNVFDKGYAIGMGSQYGNYGNQIATEFQPARDFNRYAGLRLSISY